MNLLENIRCFVLDMDGTVYLGDNLLPGSLAFMRFLQATGRDYLFLTNNSSRTAPYYAEKLTRMGWKGPPGCNTDFGRSHSALCPASSAGSPHLFGRHP